MHVLRFRFFSAPCIPVPIHAHLRYPAILCFAKDGSSSVHLFPRPPASERAAEVRSEPWSRHVNLPRIKLRFGLVQRDVLPVLPDRRHATVGSAEGCLEEDRVFREHRTDGVDVAPLPALAECVDQRSIIAIHARKYTPGRTVRSEL